MTVESPAIEWVRVVAERLGDLRDEVVFLGGATIGLLITDPATAAVRATKDVDLIVEVGTWGEYAPLQERLREKRFAEDASEGARRTATAPPARAPLVSRRENVTPRAVA